MGWLKDGYNKVTRFLRGEEGLRSGCDHDFPVLKGHPKAPKEVKSMVGSHQRLAGEVARKKTTMKEFRIYRWDPTKTMKKLE